MNIYQLLGSAIAESAGSVGSAFQLFSAGAARRPGRCAGWVDQFSDVSLDQAAERCTVNALYRGAMVRI